MANRIRLGGAVVTRIVEWQFNVLTALFPQTPAEAWQENADLLVPAFLDPEAQQCRVAIQSWVVEVDGLTVVDTGVGNDRERPHLPGLEHLSTDFLAASRRAGFDPNDVDVVIKHTPAHRSRRLEHPACRRRMGADVPERAI